MILPTRFCPMMWSTSIRTRLGMAVMRSRQHWMAMTPRRDTEAEAMTATRDRAATDDGPQRLGVRAAIAAGAPVDCTWPATKKTTSTGQSCDGTMAHRRHGRSEWRRVRSLSSAIPRGRPRGLLEGRPAEEWASRDAVDMGCASHPAALHVLSLSLSPSDVSLKTALGGRWREGRGEGVGRG